jgi:adenosylhomocysteine nucleosidase
VTDDTPKPTRGVGWAFLFALARESAPFVRRMRLLRTFADAPCPARLFATRRDPMLVLEIGVGARRAAAAARWVLEECTPRLVVACGFAGALVPTFAVGDVLVASEVVEPDEQRWRVALPAELGDLPCGRLLTASRIVATPAAKRTLAWQFGAVAVDMESAAVAEACQAARVPCACVRVISDAVDADVSPRLVELVASGRVSPLRAVAAVARSPGLALELWRLARDTRRAAARFADALHRLLD